MDKCQSVKDWMAERGMEIDRLLDLTGLDRKVLRAIMQGQYTPSPQQRQRLAEALGTEVGCIIWGHTAPVEHIHGHGPQFGRSP